MVLTNPAPWLLAKMIQRDHFFTLDPPFQLSKSHFFLTLPSLSPQLSFLTLRLVPSVLMTFIFSPLSINSPRE